MDAARIFEGLSELKRLPIEAIRAAQADRDSMVPVFLRRIEELVSSDGKSDPPSALFYVFHLLGEWREKSAYRPLANFLRLPGDELEPVLGDAKTATAHRVMAAVFDGDPGPLYEIIRDEGADEYIRSGMFATIAMLTRSGELPRAEAARFLRDCYSQLEPQHDCFVWCGWLEAVAMLGFTDLKPLVQQAFVRGSVDPTWLTFEDFEQDLQHAVEHPGAPPLHSDGDLTLFGDTIAELADWAHFEPKARAFDKPGWDPPSSLDTTEHNPLRNIGRNDPCPCGSGKKFKKCCLNSDRDGVASGGFPAAR